MGSKDKAKREMKKPKKDSKKASAPSIFQPTAEVEVINKKRKEDFTE